MSGKFESILSKLVDTEELIQIRISYVVLSISIGTTKKYLYFKNFTLEMAKVWLWPWYHKILLTISTPKFKQKFCLFKVNDRNIRKRCEICFKLQWRRSGAFINNFFTPFFLFPLLTLRMCLFMKINKSVPPFPAKFI